VIVIPMYIDIVPNRKSPPAILLRESYPENGQVKKRTWANLSKLPRNTIECLRQALLGQALVVKEALSGAIYGVLFVLNELARHCGLHRALGDSRMARLALGAGSDSPPGVTPVRGALGAGSRRESGAGAERFR